MIKSHIFKLVNNKASVLFLSNMLGLPIGFISSILLTRYLGNSGYGDFQFIINIFNLLIVLVTFGVFHGGSRAFTLSKSEREAREFYGCLIIFLIVISALTSVIILFYAILDNNIISKKLDGVLLLLIPINWMYLFINFADVIFQADNKINELSVFRVLPKFFFIVSLIALIYLGKLDNMDKLITCIYIYFFCHGIVFILIILKISPLFTNLASRVNQIVYFVKTFGFDIYIGSVVAVGMGYLSGILISYFENDNSGVGYFSLAMTLSSPLLLIPNTISTSYYKEFTSLKSIPLKMLYISLIISMISMVLLWIFVPFFIDFFYGATFNKVKKLNFILSFGFFVHGIGDFFNRFLGAQGRGKTLRDASIIIGLSTLFLNLLLIPMFSVEGSAYAKLISSLIYFLLMLYHYNKYSLLKKG